MRISRPRQDETFHSDRTPPVKGQAYTEWEKKVLESRKLNRLQTRGPKGE